MSNQPQKWRQFRPFQRDEFVLVFGDCSQGGEDFNFTQFMSATSLDFPMVYQSRGVAITQTQDLFPVLEKIFDLTGVPPVIALERNNGGQSEMQRLFDLNVKNKYRCFVMPSWGNVGMGAETTEMLGWNTDRATRPKMLGEWKSVFEKHLFKIYDEETIVQHKAFIIKNGKAQAAVHKHDDAVMSCFIAKTKILTNKGQVDIKKIKVGDMVLTRNGYQPVIKTFKLKKQVINRFGLTGTSDHPIITKGGIKRLDTIVDSDTLYIWKEKLLSIKAKNIIDTQIQNEDNIGFTSGDMINGKVVQSHFIVKFGLTTLGIYLKALFYTIKTIIHSIMIFLIWKLLKMVSTQHYTYLHQREESNLKKMAKDRQRESLGNLKNGEKNQKQLNFIGKMRLRILFYLLQLISTVQNVENHLQLDAKEEQNIVQNSVRVGQTKEVERIETVYNLTVANYPEYFANGILVHNCAGAYQLFQICKPEKSNIHGAVGNTPTPDWVKSLPTWNNWQK